MHKRLVLALSVSLLLVACVTAAPRPTPTTAPAPTAQPTPVADRTATPLPTPTPTAEPTPTAVLQDTAAMPFWDWEDLTFYRRAMRPAFAGDVDRFADATRYVIDVRIDVDASAFAGTELVRYTNHETDPLTEIVFRLLPNAPGYGGRLDVSEVTVDGVTASTSHQLGNSALYVPLAVPLAPGEAVEIGLVFEGTLPTDGSAGYAHYGYIDRVLAMPNFYPLIPVYDDEGWNVELAPDYGDATFTDTALYAARVTMSSDMILAASGTIVEQWENEDGTVTYTIATGPMRDLNLVASADYDTQTNEVDGVLVTSYYTGDEAGGARALDYATRSLGIYQDLMGPYPFSELDVASTPTRAGGIEYPGLVVVAESLYDRVGGFFELATVHEVAHQWWYSLVGNDQLDEPWLDEALTQYTSLLYLEQRYGQEAAQSLLEGTFLASYEYLQQTEQDMPAGLPVAAYSEELYGTVVYGKGPLFFHEMRRVVGDETFQEILRTYSNQYRYGIAYPQDLLAVAEQVSGTDLDSLYETWILGENE